MKYHRLSESDVIELRGIKQAVAESFSKAAKQYDAKARIQHIISDAALHRVAEIAQYKAKPWHSALDIGCGTGRVTRQLHQFSGSVTGVDLSAGMLQFAQQENTSPENATHMPAINWLLGDAEDIPVAAGSQDLVFSCMALQWLSTPECVAAECFRIMSDGGEGLLAVMVEGSLAELIHSWENLQIKPPVNTFLSSANWLKSFEKLGFNCRLNVATFIDHHKNVFSLLHSIKDIGAGLVKYSANTQQVNKTKLIALNEVYKSCFLENGALPLSYQVAFLHIRKPFTEK